VIFTSDNGPWLAKGEHGGSAFPLRGGKGGSYEGGLRVPCVMRFPGAIPPGSVCHELATQMDFLPTLARLARASATRAVDGKDITDLVLAKPDAKSPHESFFYYVGDRLHAVRSGRWKLKVPTTLAEEFAGYLNVANPDTQIPRALYDLENDPAEQKSVLNDYPDVAKKLIGLADAAREDLGDSKRNMTGKNVRPVGRSDEKSSPIAAPAGAAAPPLLASVACTSFSVMTCGGLVVTMVAVSLSLARKSEISASLPSRQILIPRLSMSACENIFMPLSVRTRMLVPKFCITVPFLTSVTTTGVVVVLVVIVAVPDMPGFNSRTDSIFPSTLNRKSSATAISLVPSGSFTTSTLPSTEMTWNFFVSDDDVVVCACAAPAVRHTSAPHNTNRIVARVIQPPVRPVSKFLQFS